MTAGSQIHADQPDAARTTPTVSPDNSHHDVLIGMVELLGRKWHPVILHCLLIGGPLGFNELKNEIEGISSKVLSDALDDLGKKGLVDREVLDQQTIRVNYAVTERGRALEPVLGSMQDWGEQYLETEDR